MPDTWFVYAILCSNDSIYIGQTKDLDNRWKQHVNGKGAQWTKKYPPVRLVYSEKVKDYLSAVRRELELKKSSGRKMLKRLLLESGDGDGRKVKQVPEKQMARTIKKKPLIKANEHEAINPFSTVWYRKTVKNTTPGKRLDAERFKRSMTQTRLSELTGIPQHHISEMENGKRPIGKETAKKLATVFKVDYRAFL